jgi:hypothetical protein
MSDPLAEIVSLLKPVPSIAKLVTAGGAWLVERHELGSPFFCAIVEGRCLLTIAGRPPIILQSGDFVLVPQIHTFTMSSLQPPPPGTLPRRLETGPGVFRLGDPDAPAEVTAMVGHCSFLANDKQLLSSLLPDIVHARGERRLMDLVGMIHAEMIGRLAARDMILSRLLEVLFIDALRSTGGAETSPGLLRGFPTSAWLQRCDAFIRTRAQACPSRNWQRPPQCRGRHSSTASEGRWASLRWNT